MIKGMHHFSFTVSNLEESVHFFRDILGLKANPVWEMKDDPIEKIVQMPGTWLKLCNVITPDNNTIELIEYVSPKGKTIDLSTCNTGVAHLGFQVDSIQETYKELMRKGLKFEHGPIPIPSEPDEPMAVLGYFRGPDNITMEFIGPLK